VLSHTRIVSASVGALLVGLSGCGYLSAQHPVRADTLTLPTAHPSVLMVITDPDSPTAMRETESLIVATARTGERLVILDDQSGAILATSTAPPPPSVEIPAQPAPLASHPTSFEKALHDKASRQYKAIVQRAEVRVRALQQNELAAWGARTVASAQTRLAEPRDGTPNIDVSLGAAAADLSSMHQVAVTTGTSTVIALVGLGRVIVPSAPVPSAGLQASTVVVDDFPDSSAAEAAWQASLLQAGAGRVMLLTGAIEDQLAFVVRQALDATVTDTLTNVLFGLGQYKLTATALSPLRQLLYLLTERYPDATATIVGYTDDLPTPGGNRRLSELRAEAVEQWLEAHGVANDRLQAFGYGDADPAAPNTSDGQPLNRRVDVIIDPTLS
jgi:outer membrane protein OmpA-like peptidoglycan-associated protein